MVKELYRVSIEEFRCIPLSLHFHGVSLDPGSVLRKFRSLMFLLRSMVLTILPLN